MAFLWCKFYEPLELNGKRISMQINLVNREKKYFFEHLKRF